MNHPDFKEAATWIAAMARLLVEGLQETCKQIYDLIRCNLICLIFQDRSNDLGSWEPEITPSQQLRNLWNYIHDGWGDFQFQIHGLGRALRGYTYADWIAEQTAQWGRNLEAYRNGAEVESHLRPLIQLVEDCPQPWEREWFASTDLSGDIRQLASKAGWHRLQELIEIMEWALASPQGQRAADLALDQLGPDPSNPWQGPYELINEILPLLVADSHTMLRQQASGLHYSQASTDALETSLESLRQSDGYSLRT